MSKIGTIAGRVLRATLFCALFSPLTLPAQNASNTIQSYSAGLPGTVVPGEYDGDLRDLPATFTPPDYYLMLNEFDDPPITLPPPVDAPATPLQRSIGPSVAMPTATQNFAGLGFSDSVTGGQAGGGWPPDINGDVGPSHFIQSVNTAYGIFNKTGTRLTALTENSLWSTSGVTGPCLNLHRGDPVVIHDALNDRWILTDFAFALSGNTPTAPFYQCFAVSKTSDPVSGGWWYYSVQIDTGGTNLPPAGTLGDYPKFGIWNDGCLYMAANGFLSSSFNGAIYGSFSLAAMESGATLTSSNSALGFIATTQNPFTMIPANLLGTSAASMPAAGTPEYFVNQSNTVYGFEVRKFTPGAGCGAGGSMSGATVIGETSYTIGSGAVVPQPGTTQKLDTLEIRLMQKVQYRKIGTAESIWVAHTTGNGTTTPTQPQWAQINVTGGTISTTLAQQQIYAPDTTLFRWMPALAVDHQGNMALSYSTSNGTAPNYPSIAYAGRLVTDTLNTLPQTETTLVSGGGSQTLVLSGSAVTRWGDYTSLSIDPSDDCTFWVTNEYYDTQANGTAGHWQTRVGSFKFPTCSSNHTVTPSVSGSGSIAPNTAQTVADGSTTQFTLTPSANNHIVNVTGTCGGSLAGNVFTTSAITADCTVVANFAIDQHTVTPSVTGNGAIAPNTAQSVNHGSTTQFTLTPNANNHIVNVTGTCGGSLAGNVFTTAAINADCTVIANFAIDQHTVTPSVTGNGAIAPNTAQSVNHGSTTQFTLTPNANNHIVNVTGTCGGSLAGNVFTTSAINADCTVIANFAIDQHTVTPSVTGNGAIAPNTAQSVNHGSTTQFTLTPNANNHIVNVTGTCGGSLAGNVFTTSAINADCTVIANFAIDQHTVTPSVTGNGAIAPNTAQSVNHGSTTQFTLTPNANNHIVNVTGTCGGSLAGNVFTTSAINADCTVVANFAIDQHTVTPSVTGNGAIAPNTAQSVNHGSTTQFTLTPNANNHILNVTGTCGGSLAGNVFTTSAINADCTVIANFAIDQHTVTPSVTGNGAIAPNTAQSVNHGSTTQFTLTPNANNHIVNVTGTCGGSLAGNVFTTSAITADCTVIANFAIDQHTVTPSVTGNGAIAPNTAQSVNHGSTTQFTLTPNANNHIVNVTGTCGGSLAGNTFTTSAITADCTVIANFAIDQHTVTPSVTGNGAIAPNTAQSVNHGSTTQFTLTPNANNHIVNVTGTCGGSLAGNVFTTSAITADCSVIANFAVNVLVFTTPPANVQQGATLGNIAVTEQDGSGNTIADTANVDFTLDICGATIDLGNVTMVGGVAALNSAQRFATLGSARQIHATATGLTGTSAQFDVITSLDWVFGDGYEACRP